MYYVTVVTVIASCSIWIDNTAVIAAAEAAAEAAADAAMLLTLC